MPHQKTNPYFQLMKIPPGYLNIMGYIDESEVNGPGRRAVVWVQGCLRECPGCFNPDSWSFEMNQLISVQDAQAPAGAQDLLNQLDLLVDGPYDGPYVASLAVHSPNSLVSSRNQRVHVFNPAFQDQLNWASDQMEIHILKDGSRIVTGYRGQMNLIDTSPIS
jgi:anaerobic ribonucleoside-triphosphate reductase activating protein